MIGIAEIATYVPEAAVSNLERLADFGVSEEFVRRKTGILRVQRDHVLDVVLEHHRLHLGLDPADWVPLQPLFC